MKYSGDMQQDAFRFIVLAGPTAAGKTSLSIEIAKKIGAEIVSADSVQIYKHLDVGSAKPTHKEQQGIPHHMIDFVELDDNYSAARYQEDARACILDIASRKRVPLVVGGTGLYVHALTYDVDFTGVCEDAAYRKELRALAEEKGRLFLHGMLQNQDPERAGAIHPNNTKRVIRALEIIKTGKKADDRSYDFRRPLPAADILMLGITRDRAALNARIDQRVDDMMEAGLIGEVEEILKAGYSPELPSLQGLGYKEMILHLRGECTLKEAIGRIKQGTRHFAKRQMTWFRRDTRIRWWDISATGSQEVLMANIIDSIRTWESGGKQRED